VKRVFIRLLSSSFYKYIEKRSLVLIIIFVLIIIKNDMYYKGAIFDFNGTLFWDTMHHNRSLDLFFEKYGVKLTQEQKFQNLHGKTNKDIFEYLFKREVSDEEALRLALEKEGMYQQLCLEGDMQLAPGAEDFFDYLKANDIPFTIATASGKENVDFYFEYLGISKWFDYDKVVYNDGTIRGKPHPDIYRKAMRVIRCNPEEVVVFEDANTGLLAAKNANAGKIIIVNSFDDDYSGWQGFQVIKHFDEVDRGLFKP